MEFEYTKESLEEDSTRELTKAMKEMPNANWKRLREIATYRVISQLGPNNGSKGNHLRTDSRMWEIIYNQLDPIIAEMKLEALLLEDNSRKK